MKPLRYSVPTVVGTELQHIRDAITSGRLSGDGSFTEHSRAKLEALTGAARVLLTGSCTHALEICALLLDLESGDEVIMPSFTFVSTANAFAMFGGVPVFVDVDPTTMNIDASRIEAAITDRTRAIVVVHYAGVAADMNEIVEIGQRYGVPIIEDAAQAVDAYHEARHLGTIGALGAFSFHDTKNVTSGGEGGALIVNDPALWSRAQKLREKGTNRADFIEGLVDKYTWVDVGSSYLMAEINAAYLLGQLEAITEITQQRLQYWHRYASQLEPLREAKGYLLPEPPDYARHNGHIFFLRTPDAATRIDLTAFLADRGVTAPFHYVPLHTAPFGKRAGRFVGSDSWTSDHAARLIRLPLFFGITEDDVDQVCEAILDFTT